MAIDYQTASPAEIDAVLAEHGSKQAAADQRAGYLRARIRQSESSKQRFYKLSAATIAEYEAEIAKQEAIAAEEQLAQLPGLTEFRTRGGWTRAFLVTNAGGHLHRSTGCSTCYPSTQFVWLTELSGKPETEIVELAGERACTICYPTAPVDVLQRASRLRPDVEAREERAKLDAEKAEKRAAKDAKALTHPDGSEIRIQYGTVKTVISGQRHIAAAAFDQLWYSQDGKRHPSHDRWEREIQMVAAALAHKLGGDADQIIAEARAKAAKKLARELRSDDRLSRF